MINERTKMATQQRLVNRGYFLFIGFMGLPGCKKVEENGNNNEFKEPQSTGNQKSETCE